MSHTSREREQFALDIVGYWLPFHTKSLQYRDYMYSGTLLIWSPVGKNNLAVLTGDSINEIIFLNKNYGSFAGRPKKCGRNNDVTVLPRWP